MALIDVKLFSTSLLTNTDIRVVLPTPNEPFEEEAIPFYHKGKKYQVLYLLHGMFGDATVWTRNTGIERYAQEYGLCVVCASVTNSFYQDVTYGPKFMTYMLEELPTFIKSTFPVSERPEDTFIAGLSMGGYGAFRLALERPENYAAAVSLSGGLDVVGRNNHRNKPGAPKESADMKAVFGDAPIEGTDNDLYALLPKRAKEGRLPKLYMCCGTEDFLYETNVNFRDTMQTQGIELTYDEGPGIHNWDYWDPQIRKVLQWLPLAGTLVDA
ncbi:MAG: esterase family protein [Lachnospiraceae bacterium]|nr:esterase family protein [Lachnospiraceae bacterium]